MKKILGWLVAGIVVIVIALVGFFYIAAGVHQQSLADQKPLTTIEIDQLAVAAGIQTAHKPTKAAPTDAVADLQAKKGASAPQPLPKRLSGTSTPEILLGRFSYSNEIARRRISREAIFMQAWEGALWMVGAKNTARGMARENAHIMMKAGQWEDARRYWNKALETGSGGGFFFGEACSHLAWLEEDPEKAAHLLELSTDERLISGNLQHKAWGTREHEKRLTNAVELALATGSDALANHYLERLRLHNPEASRRFDRESQEEDR